MVVRKIQNDPDRFFRPFLGLLVTLSLASVFVNTNGSLLVDEPFSANMTHLTWAEMFRVFLHDPSAPLYYVLLKFWAFLVGDSEMALRSFSIICFGLTVIFVGVTAAKMGGTYAGAAGAMLATTSSIGLAFAGTARPYALLSLLTAVSTLILFTVMGLIKDNAMSRGRYFFLLTGFVAINVLGLLTHPIFVFFMLACNLVAWIRSRQFFMMLSLCNLFTLGIYMLIWGPILLRTFNLPAISWMEVPDIKDLIHAYLNIWGIMGTILLVAYILVASIVNFRATRDFILSRSGFIGLGTLLGMSILPFLVSQFRPVFNDSRTPTLFFPLACVVVALLITRFGNLWLTFGLLTALVGSSIAGPAVERMNTGTEHSPRSSVRDVIDEAKCGDIFISGGLALNETSYYLRRLNAPDCIRYKVFPQSMEAHTGWMDVPRLMEHQEELTREADHLVNQLAGEVDSENRIWFFYDGNVNRQKVLDVLKDQLEREMVLTHTVEGYGTFFDQIFVYAPRK